MHRAEHRVEDIAIKAGKAHSLFWTLFSLMPLDASYRVIGLAVPFWCGDWISCDIAMNHRVEVKHRYRHSVLLGDLGADRLRALVRKREQ